MTFWKVEKAEEEENDNEDVFGKTVVTGTKKKAVQTKFCFKYNINSLRLKYQDMQYSGVTRYLQSVNLQPCNTVE